MIPGYRNGNNTAIAQIDYDEQDNDLTVEQIEVDEAGYNLSIEEINDYVLDIELPFGPTDADEPGNCATIEDNNFVEPDNNLNIDQTNVIEPNSEMAISAYQLLQMGQNILKEFDVQFSVKIEPNDDHNDIYFEGGLLWTNSSEDELDDTTDPVQIPPTINESCGNELERLRQMVKQKDQALNELTRKMENVKRTLCCSKCLEYIENQSEQLPKCKVCPLKRRHQ